MWKRAVNASGILDAFTLYPATPTCAEQNLVPAGSQVIVTSTYRDFAAVQVEKDGSILTGYLPKAALSALPQGVTEQPVEQVPWKPVVLFSNWQYYTPEEGGSIIASPQSEEQSDWVNDAHHHPVAAPMRIHFGLKNTSTRWGGVRIMGTPESSTQQWWEGIIRLDVFTGSGSYHLGFRDGTTEEFITQLDLPVSDNEEITLLVLDANGRRLQIVNAAGKVVEDVDVTRLPGGKLSNGLFPSGWFQFGTTIGPPGTLKVTHLSITTPPDGVNQAGYLTEPGLAELAAPKNIWIGTEFSPDLMTQEDYCAIIQHDFNLAYLSAFANGALWTAPGEYNFAILDHDVNSAASNGMTIYASHLVLGAYGEDVLPDWLRNGHYSKAELLAILEQHITTLVSRYKDKVKIWSIANEAPSRDITSGADFWFDHIGPEYIEKSLQWARQADPDGILILNADNNESPRDADTRGNIERLYRMVSDLKARGVPVDAVGMQMHFFLPWNSRVMPVKEDVIATMQKFGALNVKVMITEMDVNLHEVSGSAEEKQQLQTQLYQDMASACVESGVCIAFSTWGVGDSTSWITCEYKSCVYQHAMPDAAPLLFDASFQPKPAYFAVRKVFAGE